MVKMWLNAEAPVTMTMRPHRGGEAFQSRIFISPHHSVIMIKMWPGSCMLIERLLLFGSASPREVIEDFWGCCHSLRLANLCFWVEFKEVLKPLFHLGLFSGCLTGLLLSRRLPVRRYVGQLPAVTVVRLLWQSSAVWADLLRTLGPEIIIRARSAKRIPPQALRLPQLSHRSLIKFYPDCCWIM